WRLSFIRRPRSVSEDSGPATADGGRGAPGGRGLGGKGTHSFPRPPAGRGRAGGRTGPRDRSRGRCGPARGPTVASRTGSPPDQASADHVAAAARGWKTRQQADVEVVRYDPRAGPGSAANADVWVLPAAELGRRADAGEVRTVPAEVLDDEAYAWGGLLPLYR